MDPAQPAAGRAYPYISLGIRIQAHRMIARQPVSSAKPAAVALEEALHAISIRSRPQRAIGRLRNRNKPAGSGHMFELPILEPRQALPEEADPEIAVAILADRIQRKFAGLRISVYR